MDIRFKCPGCGKDIAVPAQAAGMRLRCPGCGLTVKAPSHDKTTEPPAAPVVTAIRDHAEAPSLESTHPDPEIGVAPRGPSVRALSVIVGILAFLVVAVWVTAWVLRAKRAERERQRAALAAGAPSVVVAGPQPASMTPTTQPGHLRAPPTATNRPTTRPPTRAPDAQVTNAYSAQTQESSASLPTLIVAAVGPGGSWTKALPLSDLWDRQDCFEYYSTVGAKLEGKWGKPSPVADPNVAGYEQTIPAAGVRVAIRRNGIALQISDTNADKRLAWMAIGSVTAPRCLIAVSGITVRAEFRGTPDGFEVSLANQPCSKFAGACLTPATAVCVPDDPDFGSREVQCSVRTGIDSLDIGFRLPSGDMEKIRSTVRQRIRDNERSLWETNNPARTCTNLLGQVRDVLKSNPTEDHKVRKSIRDIIEKYEIGLKGVTTAAGDQPEDAKAVDSALDDVADAVRDIVRERCQTVVTKHSELDDRIRRLKMQKGRLYRDTDTHDHDSRARDIRSTEEEIRDMQNMARELGSERSAKETLARLQSFADPKTRSALFDTAFSNRPIGRQSDLITLSVEYMQKFLGMSCNERDGKLIFPETTALAKLAQLPIPRPPFVSRADAAVVVPRRVVFLAKSNRTPVLQIEGVAPR